MVGPPGDGGGPRGAGRPPAVRHGAGSLGLGAAGAGRRRRPAGRRPGLLRAHPPRGAAAAGHAGRHHPGRQRRVGAADRDRRPARDRRPRRRPQPDDLVAAAPARAAHPHREAGLGGAAGRRRGARDRQPPGGRARATPRSCAPRRPPGGPAPSSRPPSGGDALDRVKAETQRIHRIIQDLLDYSRPTREEAQATEPLAVLRSAEALLRAAGPLSRGSSFTPSPTPAPGPLVQVSPGRLRQVFVNLLLNAADAMDGAGPVTVTRYPRRRRGRPCDGAPALPRRGPRHPARARRARSSIPSSPPSPPARAPASASPSADRSSRATTAPSSSPPPPAAPPSRSPCQQADPGRPCHGRRSSPRPVGRG